MPNAQALRTVGREIGATIRKAQDDPEWFQNEVPKSVERLESGGLQQPIYDPIDLVVDLATGGGKLWTRLIDSVFTGSMMTGIDLAGGGPLTQIAGTMAGHAGIQAARTAIVRKKVMSQVLKQIDEAGGSPVLNEIGAITYHGTPHKFEPTNKNPLGEFDLSKIGTGEGAQTYGHGIYLAGHPDVAKNYQEILSFGSEYNNRFKIGDKEYSIKELFDETNFSPEIVANLADGKTGEQIINDIKKEGLATDDIIEFSKRQIKELEKLGVSRPKGNLYKVDLPDEQIAKMLDWDKPLSKQPENIRKALTGVQGINIESWLSGNKKGSELYHELVSRAQDAGLTTGRNLSDDRIIASELLNKVGIPGIKYLDQGSRAAGEGTRNFVLFDPSIAKIIGRE